MKTFTTLFALLILINTSMAMAKNMDTKNNSTLRIATFNVSMEALNYAMPQKNGTPAATGDELESALNSNHQQIRNIAEIIQRVNPDIILLNEFDRRDEAHQLLKTFLRNYLEKSQNKHKPINYPYFYQGPVNTGVISAQDINADKKNSLPGDAYGFGYFPGHFGMALLSKYPIDEKNIRTFQFFKWKDMPNALKPINPETKTPWYSEQVWNDFRLSSKSHWDIPVNVNGHELHVLASHPTPPVFDGAEDRNGKRNHDELRFWVDYLTPKNSDYIYDDKKSFGGLAQDKAFVILGDLNADSIDGNAIKAGIKNLTTHIRVTDPKPMSESGQAHTPDSKSAKNHTAFWRMRADYVLPSAKQFNIINSGIFWPSKTDEAFRLIKDRAASSDHRLVWVDVEFKK